MLKAEIFLDLSEGLSFLEVFIT